MEVPCVTSYPQLLPPLQGGERYGVMPPRFASWRRTADGAFFLANDVNAIPAAKVEMANIDELFPGHAEIFGEAVSGVLYAASSGFINDWEAHSSEQVFALRAMMLSPHSKCEWAADALKYLLDAGCFADDNSSTPCVIEELKMPRPDKELIAVLLARTNIDRVLRGHGLHGAPPETTIREHLMRTARDDMEYVYGLDLVVPVRTSPPDQGKRRREEGDGTDDEGDKQVDLYKGSEYDFCAEDGKAPVGAGKLPL